jgi:hypothetical protein
MSERSERIINTGFGEALCAEPVTGAPVRERGWSDHATLVAHQ